MRHAQAALVLRPWSENDRAVLDRTVGDPEMMRHLGGAEAPAALDSRHLRYVALAQTGPACMYVIEVGGEREPAGTIGFWKRTWRGRPVFETGWMVFPEFARRGVATAAGRLIVEKAGGLRARRYLHAFPAVGNGPSNAVCRKLGFENMGPCEIEYPKGVAMLANNWRAALW